MIKTDFGSTDLKLEWHTMTDAEKQSACLWRYEGEYVMYNLPSYEEMKAKRRGFMRPEAEKNYYSFYDGDRFVGYVNLAEKESEVSIGIGVSPEYCNRGYGQRIMSETCRIAERLYPEKPLCLQVRVWNKRAINCYLKSGFMIDGESYFLETHAGSGLFYKMIKKESLH